MSSVKNDVVSSNGNLDLNSDQATHSILPTAATEVSMDTINSFNQAVDQARQLSNGALDQAPLNSINQQPAPNRQITRNPSTDHNQNHHNSNQQIANPVNTIMQLQTLHQELMQLTEELRAALTNKQLTSIQITNIKHELVNIAAMQTAINNLIADILTNNPLPDSSLSAFLALSGAYLQNQASSAAFLNLSSNASMSSNMTQAVQEAKLAITNIITNVQQVSGWQPTLQFQLANPATASIQSTSTVTNMQNYLANLINTTTQTLSATLTQVDNPTKSLLIVLALTEPITESANTITTTNWANQPNPTPAVNVDATVNSTAYVANTAAVATAQPSGTIFTANIAPAQILKEVQTFFTENPQCSDVNAFQAFAYWQANLAAEQTRPVTTNFPESNPTATRQVQQAITNFSESILNSLISNINQDTLQFAQNMGNLFNYLNNKLVEYNSTNQATISVADLINDSSPLAINNVILGGLAQQQFLQFILYDEMRADRTQLELAENSEDDYSTKKVIRGSGGSGSSNSRQQQHTTQ